MNTDMLSAYEFKVITSALNSFTDECIPYSHKLLHHIGKSIPICRFVCTLAHGEPPTPTHQAAHECGNGHHNCINPKHLKWRTPLENSLQAKIHRWSGKPKIKPKLF
jgi:hypothetical protein